MPPLNMRGLVRGTRSRARTRDFGVVSEQDIPAPSKPASVPPAPAPKTAAAKADGRGGAAGQGGPVASGKRAVPVPRRNNSLWNEWSCQEVREEHSRGPLTVTRC